MLLDVDVTQSRWILGEFDGSRGLPELEYQFSDSPRSLARVRVHLTKPLAFYSCRKPVEAMKPNEGWSSISIHSQFRIELLHPRFESK
jgi:hypothetical protein